MKIKIDLKLSNWNDTIKYSRNNKYYANQVKQQEMQDISWFIKKMKPIEEYPIKITFYWHIKNVCSDLDNKSCKAILDCMQKLNILENDNIKYIRQITNIAIKDNKDYVEMEIEEY